MDPYEVLTQLERRLKEIADFKARNTIWVQVDLEELLESLIEAKDLADDLLDWSAKGGYLPDIRNR